MLEGLHPASRTTTPTRGATSTLLQQDFHEKEQQFDVT